MNLKNNIYLRSNRSIKTISLTRICMMIPLIIFGLYKNGICLYREEYITFIEIFRPILYVLIGALCGIIVNIIYEKMIRKNNDDLISIIFSSFHVEYGVILGMITSINTNIILYTLTVFIIFFISKRFKNRVNIMCIIMIIIYCLTNAIFSSFSYLNISEAAMSYNYEFMDYLIGKYPGGISATHNILIILATMVLFILNDSKTTISISSIASLLALFGIYSLITNSNFSSMLFSNNLIMLMCFIANDFQTSSYTQKGMIFYGISVGILTFALTFINPVLAPFISILIVSLFNNLIDRKFNTFYYK